jgi:MFS family permease
LTLLLRLRSVACSAMSSRARVVCLLCLAEALSMAGFSTYAALLPLLRDAWELTGKQAGVIAGAYFAGYMIAVPILSALTDRIDARRIYVASALLAASGLLGFALAATGPVPAALFQAIAGAGLAGTYMPGLKLLSERVDGPLQSRYVGFYTATFGIGTSLSLLLAGWTAQALGWSWSFAWAAPGPLIAAAIVALGLDPIRPATGKSGPPPSVPRGLLADRAVRSYVIGYAAHCWELFGLRSWMVAFVAFCFGSGVARGATPATIAALINLLGLLASVSGNEIAARVGRRKFIVAAMVASATLAWIVGFTASASWWIAPLLLAVYFVFVMADSAALTAGFVAVAPPAQRGAAMAVYSFVGFGAGFLAPLAFGAVLDLTGGKDDALAWGFAFGSLGLGCALAPLAFRKPGRAT